MRALIMIMLITIAAMFLVRCEQVPKSNIERIEKIRAELRMINKDIKFNKERL